MYTFELTTKGQKACGFMYSSYFIISNLYKYFLNYKQYSYLAYIRMSQIQQVNLYWYMNGQYPHVHRKSVWISHL